MASLDFGINYGGFNPATLEMSGSASASRNLPIEPTLPSWLPTDPNALNAELRQQYGGRGIMKQAKKAGQAIDRMQQFNLSTGTQMANNAASSYAQRVRQQGGTAFDADAVKAQAMMGVLQQNAGLGLEKQDRLLQAKMKASEMKANLAGAINQSRLGYLGTLAGTYTGMRGQNITYDYQQDMLGKMGGKGSTASGQVPTGMGGGFGNYSMGYIPNSGPITPAMLGGQVQPNSVFTAFGGPGATAYLR